MGDKRDRNRHKELKGVRSPVINISAFDVPEGTPTPARLPSPEQIAGVRRAQTIPAMKRHTPAAAPRSTPAAASRATPAGIATDVAERDVRMLATTVMAHAVNTTNLADFDLPEPKASATPSPQQIASRGAPIITS